MSETPVKAKIGRLSFLSPDGSCSVTIDDGSGKSAAAKDPKAALQAEELEKAKREAHKRGFDEAQKKAAAEIASLKQQLDAAKSKLPEALAAYFSDLEEQLKGEIVELGFKVAEAVAGVDMERNDRTAEAIRAALGAVVNPGAMKIHVNPAFVSGGHPTPPAGAAFVADPKLKPGEIGVECQNGFIDGTLKSRLATLKEALLKDMGRVPDSEETAVEGGPENV